MGGQGLHALLFVEVWKRDVLTHIPVVFWESSVKVFFASDSSSKSHVFLLNGNSVGVNAAQVGIFKYSNEISFSSLLEGDESLSLESHICLTKRVKAD